MKCLTLTYNFLGKQNSQLENFDFNSMAELEGLHLGANSQGLFLLSGDKDIAEEITSEVSFAKTDFGVQNVKRIHTIYFWLRITQALDLKIETENGVFETAITPKKTTEVFRYPVRVPSNLFGRQFQITLTSKKGRFSLDSIDVFLILLHSGHV